MRLINTKNDRLLADRITVASKFLSRLRGLMGKPGLEKGEALIILPCKSVHTFFMRFDIDVVFLDRDCVVLHTIENMKPYRWSSFISKSYMVVEMPAGVLSATSTRVGDKIKLIIKEGPHHV